MNRFYLLTLYFLAISIEMLGQFVNATVNSGLEHTHISTNTLGGGVLFFDSNNDGWEDIIMTGGSADDALYINNGDGTFEDRSNNMAQNRAKSVITSSCAAADLNRDGLTDLFFGTLNSDEPNILLINIGDDTYLNVSKQAGFVEAAQTLGAVFWDYNNDGLLDIYVLNYVLDDRYTRDENNKITGYEHICYQNFLYRNDGEMAFTEVSDQLGLNGAGCSLAGSVIPIAGYGQGLYVVHDFGEWVQPNELLVYDTTTNTFIDIAPTLGLDVELYGMGLGVGDYDNDLDIDLYVTNIGANMLLENQLGNYVDVAVELGVDNTTDIDNGLFTTGWSNLFWDYNNDELLDLYVVNGHIPVAEFLENSRRDNNILFQNIGRSFLNVSEETELDYDYVNRGASLGDFDNDGMQDLVIATTRPGGDAVLPELNYQLFQNSILDRSYIKVELEGTISNKEGYGALVYIHTGPKTQMRYQYSGGVHASQNSTVLHVGLSDRIAIDSISVVWPSGIRDSYKNPPINQTLLITEGNERYDILGCTDSENNAYNSMATINSGCAGTTTSTADISANIGFQLFPNPADEDLFITWSESTIELLKLELVNAMGQILLEQVDPINNVTIPIKKLPLGTYYIRGVTQTGQIAINTFTKL